MSNSQFTMHTPPALIDFQFITLKRNVIGMDTSVITNYLH